jgi:hemolysin III
MVYLSNFVVNTIQKIVFIFLSVFQIYTLFYFMLIQNLGRIPVGDSGPIYQETILGRLPVEPFNTASNLLFLFVIIYWTIKIYPNFSTYRFLVYVLSTLFIGYVGGTIYHGTRSHEIWLLMDWVPIFILSVSAVVYFFKKLGIHWFIMLVLVLFPFVLMFSLDSIPSLPRPIKNLIEYSSLALIILLPIFFYLRKTNWLFKGRIFVGLLLFCIAIFFRTLDDTEISNKYFPMGTHFLWHIFGALAVHALISYLYLVKKIAVK